MSLTSAIAVESGTAIKSSPDQVELNEVELRLLKQALLGALGLIPAKNRKKSPHNPAIEPNTRAIQHLLKGLTNQAEHQASSKFQQFIDALFPLIRDLVDDLNQFLREEQNLRNLFITIVPATNLEIQFAQALGLAKNEKSYFYVLFEDAQPAILAADSRKEPSNNEVTQAIRICILIDAEEICNKFLTSKGTPNSSGAYTLTLTEFAETLVSELTGVIREIYFLTFSEKLKNNEQQINQVRSPVNQDIQNKLSKAFTGFLNRVQAVVSGQCNALSLRITCTSKVSQWEVFGSLEKHFSQFVENIWKTILSATPAAQKSEEDIRKSEQDPKKSGQDLKERLRGVLLDLESKLRPQVTDAKTVTLSDAKGKAREVSVQTFIEYLETEAFKEIRELKGLFPGEQSKHTLAYFALMASGGYMSRLIFQRAAEKVFEGKKNSRDLDYSKLHASLQRITLACTLLGMLGDEANLRLRGIQNLFLGEIGLDPLFSFLSNLGGFATPDGVELLNSLLRETVAYTVARIFPSVKDDTEPKTPLKALAQKAPQFEDFVEQVKKFIVPSRKGLFSLCWKILRKALSKGVPIKTSLSQVGDVKVADIVRIGFVGLTEEDQDLVKEILYASGARHYDQTNPDGQLLVALSLPEQEVLCEVMFKPYTENGANETDRGDNDNNSRLPHDIYDVYKGIDLAKKLADTLLETA